jgi:hypothetical protein
MSNAMRRTRTVVHDNLVGQIRIDFAQAGTELAQARLRLRDEDSRANRAAVAECSARVDAVLDLFLETCRADQTVR